MQARQVLLDRVDMDSDGSLVPNDGFERRFYGATDGEMKMRFFGVTARERVYTSERDNTQAMYQAGKLMKNIGRGVHFTVQERIYGCLIKSYVFYPVVLAFYENEAGDMVLAGFSPRCFTSRIAVGLAMKKFDQEVDGLVERSDKKPVKPKKVKLTREERKLRKHSKWPVSKTDPNMVWNGRDWVTRAEAEAEEAAKEAEKAGEVAKQAAKEAERAMKAAGKKVSEEEINRETDTETEE